MPLLTTRKNFDLPLTGDVRLLRMETPLVIDVHGAPRLGAD